MPSKAIEKELAKLMGPAVAARAHADLKGKFVQQSPFQKAKKDLFGDGDVDANTTFTKGTWVVPNNKVPADKDVPSAEKVRKKQGDLAATRHWQRAQDRVNIKDQGQVTKILGRNITVKFKDGREEVHHSNNLTAMGNLPSYKQPRTSQGGRRRTARKTRRGGRRRTARKTRRGGRRKSRRRVKTRRRRY